MKYLKYPSMVFICFLIISCEKENPISILDVAGQYDGQKLDEHGSGVYSATIQPGVGDTVVIDFWPSAGQFIKMQVERNILTIPPQIFEVDNGSVAHPHCCDELRLTATGIYQNGKIELEYMEEKRGKPEDAFVKSRSGYVYLHKRK